jgi:signal transduction histidine kinase
MTSRASERLIASKERVLTQWLQRLRAEVPAAAAEKHPILIDTLPALLDHLAEALAPDHPRHSATDGTTIAEEHGGERVRVTQFRLEDVITEYKVLRDVLVTVLDEGGPLTPDERRVLHASIDQAMTKASIAYVLVHEGMREQLFAVLTHDLRGPLNVASIGLSMILRTPTSDQVPRWAARAADAIDRVDRMIQDLLDAMRVQAGGRVALDLQECDLVDVARQSIEQLQTIHGDRFVLEAPGPARGHFSPDALRRAIENLANNAVKYGAVSRPVTIAVRTLHGRAILTVHNEGSYIPPDQQETLFRAFHRLPSAEQGTKRGWGLGLAQVRGVAEAHGGSIGIDSLPDRGTTFVIDLPLDARPHQPAPRTP